MFIFNEDIGQWNIDNRGTKSRRAHEELVHRTHSSIMSASHELPYLSFTAANDRTTRNFRSLDCPRIFEGLPAQVIDIDDKVGGTVLQLQARSIFDFANVASRH